jgi:hypothetical protein
MEKILLFTLSTAVIFLFSCNSNRKKIISKAWNFSYYERIINDSVVDSDEPNLYIQFNENGEMTREFSIYVCDYQISGDKIYFGTNKKPHLISFENPNSFSILDTNISENEKYSSKEVYNSTNIRKKKYFDKLIYNLSREFYVSFRDTLGTGEFLFEIHEKDHFRNDFSPNPFYSAPRIKDIIDKTLNTIPIEINEHKFTVLEHYLYDSYKYDTPSISIKLQNVFENDIHDNSIINLDSRIWIREK